MEACGLAGHLRRVLMQTWDPLTGNMSPEELERERDESGADGPTGTFLNDRNSDFKQFEEDLNSERRAQFSTSCI